MIVLDTSKGAQLHNISSVYNLLNYFPLLKVRTQNIEHKTRKQAMQSEKHLNAQGSPPVHRSL